MREALPALTLYATVSNPNITIASCYLGRCYIKVGELEMAAPLLKMANLWSTYSNESKTVELVQTSLKEYHAEKIEYDKIGGLKGPQ